MIADTVLAIDWPESDFSDEGGPGTEVGLLIAKNLNDFFRTKGYEIPEVFRDGCEEDAWVYTEARLGDEIYSFVIMLFGQDGRDSRMAIQVNKRLSFWGRLFGPRNVIAADDQIVLDLREFGSKNQNPEMMTEERFRELT